MKSTSTPILMILIFLIAISITALGYFFVSNASKSIESATNQSASQQLLSVMSEMKIESLTDTVITIVNTGRTNLTNFSVFINDIPVSIASGPQNAAPGERVTITLSNPLNPGDIVKVTTSEGALALMQKPPLSVCQPASCYSLGKNCSTWSDGCGGTLDCGSCPGTCNNGVCTGSCVPTTCLVLGKTCGSWSDGCSGTLNCGSCMSGTCVNGQCQSSNLIAYWKFDESSGTVASDSSGNGNNGTLVNGPVWTSGKVGNALQFDGVNDYVRVDNVPVNTTSGGYNTIAFWMYWNGVDNQVPFSWYGECYDLWEVSDTFGFNTCGSDVYGISGANSLANKWVHVVAIFPNNYPTNEPSLYINGVKQSISLFSGSRGTRSAGSSVNIGSMDSNSYFFNGMIDQVKVWNRALTASEVQAEYGSQNPYCGDSSCNNGETQGTCCTDCGCPAGQSCIGNVCQVNPTTCSGTISVSNDDMTCGSTKFTIAAKNTGSSSLTVDIYDEVWTDRNCDGAREDYVDSDWWTGVSIPSGGTVNEQWTSTLETDPSICYIHTIYYCSEPFISGNSCYKSGSDSNQNTCWYQAASGNIIISWGDSRFQCTVSSGTTTGGLSGDYYNDMSLTNYVLTRTDQTINFDWGYGSPDPSVNADGFSVRWQGYVKADYPEAYTFYVTTDDGSRLWVDGQLVVDSWIDQGPTEHSGSISLTAGWHAIKYEYYENGGGAVAQLSYSSPSTAKQIIPSDHLGYSGPGGSEVFVYDDQDPATFSGGWGWDGWNACCLDNAEKYYGSYSYRVEGGSEAWASPLPSSVGKSSFTFAYKKQDPNAYFSVFYFVNGYWHQITDDSHWYQGWDIPHIADTDWHVVTVLFSQETAGTNGEPLVSSQGQLDNFEYGPGGSNIIWFDYTFFS